MNRGDLQNIAFKANKQIVLIRSAIEKAENEFMLIGSKLITINSFSKTINGSTKSITDSFQSGVIENNIKEISIENLSIVDYLSDSLSNFVLIESTIDSINNLLEESLTYLFIYDKIKIKLNMLSVLIRIETGWLQSSDSGFSSLSESIIGLSETISHEINNVRIQISSIITYLDNAKKMVKGITLNIRNSINEINSEISHSTNLFLEDMLTKNKKLSDIKTEINSVFADISNVITLCQVQDATKQKLEHLIDNIPLLNEQIDLYDTDEQFEFAFALVEKTLQIENSQLIETKRKFLHSRDEIIRSIHNIAHKSLTVKSKMSNILVADNKSKDRNIIEKIIEEVVPLANKLSINIKHSQEVFFIINDVINKLETIAEFINKIVEISDEIDLLSINSIIKASRLGSQGAALAVISEQIKILSETSQYETNRITEQLQIIGSETKKLSDIYKKSDQENMFIAVEKGINNISTKLLALETENKLINDNVKEMFDQVFNIVSEINQLGQKIINHNYFDQQLSEVNNVFAGICNQISSNGFTTDYSYELGNNEFLKNMIDKYSMESERIIHKKHMNGLANNAEHNDIKDNHNNDVLFFDDFSADSTVELFDNDSTSENSVVFDDNIELF